MPAPLSDAVVMVDPLTAPRIWFRLLLPSGAIGPGKVELMRAVVATGSVSGAARSLRMSHARSVKLVAEINGMAATALIDTRAGGQSGGGASLTPLGLAVLAAYAAVEDSIEAAAAAPLAKLAQTLSQPLA